ncbi:hypothetical protein LCGC14_0637580 [marine sediment metagenome]|uniref:Radical SAM core domain-containing protein n=1 Tax=marine sediment metagenome TaxID=412755 RepID=A0A0F9RJE6_9ZZZZ
MNIALMDLDHTGFPNLALMKLSAKLKAEGHEVALNFPLGADRVYASCVFSWNKKGVVTLPPEAIIGGSAISLDRLPDDVEHIMPDYSLYGIDYSVGFTSRGCYNNCSWCIVPAKEGPCHDHANIYEFWNPGHKKIKLLDDSLLASPKALETLETLGIEGLAVDFCQGLDIRCITPENAVLLKKIKHWGQLRFAFDSLEYESAVRAGVELLRSVGFAPSTMLFYVLLGAGESVEEEIHRLQILNEYRIGVFPMFFVPKDSPSRVWNDTYMGKLGPVPIDLPQVRGPRGSWQKMMRRIITRLKTEAKAAQ